MYEILSHTGSNQASTARENKTSQQGDKLVYTFDFSLKKHLLL